MPQADIPSETPAFLCEKISIDVDLKKVADMAVDDLIQRQNVLYISRGQLKKHISTMLNFNISIRFISQQVRNYSYQGKGGGPGRRRYTVCVLFSMVFCKFNSEKIRLGF